MQDSGASEHALDQRAIGGIPLRAVPANAVTALALCFGLTGVRFAIGGEFDKAVAAVVFAGVLDGLDGRIARLLRGQSRFGAELDSLSDVIAFGVTPAVILYLWSLAEAPRFGWIAALALTVCAALRLARFNANIDRADQPHKSAGFNTGVPAPAGAGLAFLPIFLWLVTRDPVWRDWTLVLPWTVLIALLMISNLATFSWSSLRLRPGHRILLLAFVGLLGAALITIPWITLAGVSLVYIATMPFSWRSYRVARRNKAGQQTTVPSA